MEILNRLQTRFMRASMKRFIELKGRLSHIKKSDSHTMDGYLTEIKVIVDSLAAIQCPDSNQDLVQFALFGLDNRGSDYDHIVTALLHYLFALSFDDLRPKLLLHEQRIKSSKEGLHSSSYHALVAVQSIVLLIPLLRIIQVAKIQARIIKTKVVTMVAAIIKIVVNSMLEALVTTTTMLMGVVIMV